MSQTIARRVEYMRATAYREHLAAGDHFPRRSDAMTYVDARGRGESPAGALSRVQTERTVCAVLSTSTDDDGAPYRYPVESWDVDTDELARVTAGPMSNVVRPDGTHPDGTVTLPPGATARLYLYNDDDGSDDDAECYNLEDIAAWHADRWHFAGLAAVVTLANGDTGEDALWGIEVGSYWPGSTEAQLWDNIPDVIGEAAAYAILRTRDVSTALAPPLF